MYKSFEICETKSSSFPLIIFSKDYLRFNTYLNEVESFLKYKYYTGPVIFDLLLSNGLGSNRYITAYFDGDCIVEDSFNVLYHVNKELLDYSLLYYSENRNLLKNGVLSNREIEALKAILNIDLVTFS